MSETVRIKDKQSLLDIAAQLYGSVDGVFELLKLNPDLGFDNPIEAGKEIIYDVIDFDDKAIYLSGKNIATDADINTASLNWILHSGCWNDGNVWIDSREWIDNCDGSVLSFSFWDDGKKWTDSEYWSDTGTYWIMKSGFWDDLGLWVDTKNWID